MRRAPPRRVQVLGYAEEVSEQTLGEETYTFLEGVSNPFSCATAHPTPAGPLHATAPTPRPRHGRCTILIKGAHPHVISQIKESGPSAPPPAAGDASTTRPRHVSVGEEEDRASPTIVAVGSESRAVAVSAGGAHTASPARPVCLFVDPLRSCE